MEAETKHRESAIVAAASAPALVSRTAQADTPEQPSGTHLGSLVPSSAMTSTSQRDRRCCGTYRPDGARQIPGTGALSIEDTRIRRIWDNREFRTEFSRRIGGNEIDSATARAWKPTNDGHRQGSNGREGAKKMKPAAFLISALAWASTAQAAGPIPQSELVREAFKLEVEIDGTKLALEGLSVLPPGDGPFPLALMAHGTPRGGVPAYPTVTPFQFIPQLEEFARRGYAAVIVLRRGFGQSEGRAVEFTPGCDAQDHVASLRHSGNDMRSIARALRAQPKLDMNRFVAVGYSTGGLAVMSMTRERVEGLALVIGFTPTRGSRGPNDTCNAARLVEATQEVGMTSRTPTVWIYAANDSFASIPLARRMFDAFRAGGGQGEFVELPGWGSDGHNIFSRAGIPDWRPLVDRALAAHGLPNWSAPPPDSGVAELAPPAGVNAVGWRAYLEAPPFKAFAANGIGSWAYRSGLRSEQAARNAALSACSSGGRDPCRIVAVDDALAR
jgi:dienelactone hydrolase